MNTAPDAIPARWPAPRSTAGLPAWGGRVNEIVQKLPHDKYYLTYLPFPTELCVLCKPRTKKGLDPACVQHCMARAMTYGPIEELAEKMKEKPRMVLWVPK